MLVGARIGRRLGRCGSIDKLLKRTRRRVPFLLRFFSQLALLILPRAREVVPSSPPSCSCSISSTHAEVSPIRNNSRVHGSVSFMHWTKFSLHPDRSTDRHTLAHGSWSIRFYSRNAQQGIPHNVLQFGPKMN